ncbi:MAG: dicarboxylate/amino acid:cation symporter [Rhodospirillales bacterium]|nr:dicarboxylate/amino acid:cation symporter [Rhodospirillales bacterium]MCB9994945.1 dicarboxylate/amino acid:cation symporter [Rhodospirillales bacterium]
MPAKQSARGKSLSESTQFMISQHLWLRILAGMVLGIITGLLLSPSGFALVEANMAFTIGEWIKLPGVVFLGLIQMVIVPLVICSIILGIAESGSMEMIRRLGLRIIPYFITTTVIAISIGMALVHIIHPGTAIDPALAEMSLASGAAADSIPSHTFNDLTIPQRIANLIPTNPAKAELERNMLQIVIASMLAGLALLGIEDKTAKPFKDLCIAGQVLSMKIISWGMVIAPFAAFGLLGNITIRIGADALVSVGLYMVTVLTALACMMAVYLLIVKLFSDFNIRQFVSGIREAQLIAFSTSSSAATMPVSIQCAEEKLDIRPDVSRFVIPLGATINMDGTALYQAVAAVFLCQVFGVDLSPGELVLLMMTTVGASIGTPATPGVGIVVLATILVGIGVPAEGIALIIGVDRILDMCRTTVNVTGDLTASAVMQKWLSK